jgi:hypothetical protein
MVKELWKNSKAAWLANDGSVSSRAPVHLSKSSIYGPSRPYGEWSEGDYDVLEDSTVVWRIIRQPQHPYDRLGCRHWPSGIDEDRSRTHGYAATRDDATGAFAKSWRRV